MHYMHFRQILNSNNSRSASPLNCPDIQNVLWFMGLGGRLEQMHCFDVKSYRLIIARLQVPVLEHFLPCLFHPRFYA